MAAGEENISLFGSLFLGWGRGFFLITVVLVIVVTVSSGLKHNDGP
jgi:hypothetical protein